MGGIHDISSGKRAGSGETCGAADHDHDLIHDLSKQLDAVWRYDQYIADAESKPAIQDLWRDLKAQEI